jgi:uncharacterized damage-inducible protein DinB
MALLVREQLLTMARYNVWATRHLLRACDALSDDEYHRDVGLFFQSVHGTLNHIAIAEHDVWFRRVHDRESPRDVDLGHELESDRTQLRQMLLAKAERWLPLLEHVDDEMLTGYFEYQSLSGEPHRLPFMATMMHVFNHGTHHRGQVTAALTMLGHESPSIDLVYMLQEEQAKSAS